MGSADLTRSPSRLGFPLAWPANFMPIRRPARSIGFGTDFGVAQNGKCVWHGSAERVKFFCRTMLTLRFPNSRRPELLTV